MQLLRSKDGAGEGSETTEVAEVVEGQWLVVEDEHAAPDSAEGKGAAITLARYLREPEAWKPNDQSWTVVIAPDDELLDLPAAVLDRSEILIAFPAFTDGRGYSHAATLKQRHGFAGTLVAIGDVRRDQLEFMRETGFTAYQITGNDSVDDMIKSLVELEMPAHRLYSGAAIDRAAEGQAS